MPDQTIELNDLESIEEKSWQEEIQEDRSDVIPNRPPIALLSVTRALSRRWQDLDEAITAPSNIADEDGHYLSELSSLAELNETLVSDVDLDLLAELGRVVAGRLRRRLRASRKAHGQLAREIATLAESPGPHTATPQPARRQRTCRKEFLGEEPDLACAPAG